MKPSFLPILFLCCCLLNLPTLFSKEKEEQPNVLFIMVDDLRPELHCYGADYVKSPQIDKLAQSGMLFKRAYCSSPVCGPSRVATLLGMRLNRPKQASSHNVQATKLFPDIEHIATLFQKAGYETITGGKTFHNPADLKIGWTTKIPLKGEVEDEGGKTELASSPLWRRPVDPKSYQLVNERTGRGPILESPDVEDDAYVDGELATKAIDELKRLKNADKPFFFACGFVRPHLPFYAPKKYWDLYKREEIPLAENNFLPKNAPKELKSGTEFSQYHLLGLKPGSEEFARAMKHGYLASVSYVDAQIGRVLTALKKEGLDRNTIVVLWGDHGWNLGEHSFWGKHNLVDTATRVPIIIRVPGEKAGEQSSVIESVDIVPTLCELAHIPLEGRSGTSLLPLVRNASQKRSTPAFSIFGQGKTIITDDFSYTIYGKGEAGHRMLFDHRKDKAENENVAEEDSYAETKEKLHAQLSAGLDLENEPTKK